MGEASHLESKRAVNLTDKQLLEILAARGSDLAILKSFQFLDRMFEVSAAKNEVAAPGLECARGLMRVYSQNFAPGHPAHPFKQYGGLSIQGVFSAIPAGRAPKVKEREVASPVPAVLHIVKENDIGVASAPAPKPMVPKIYMVGNPKPSKCAMIREFIKDNYMFNEDFTVALVHRKARALIPGITQQNVANAVSSMRTKGDVEPNHASTMYGAYRRVGRVCAEA